MNGALRLSTSLVFFAAVSAARLVAKEPSPALQAARQLNEAFVEVAESVSPSVVVIKIATKTGKGIDWDGNPLLEQVPEEQREQFERFFRRFRGFRGAPEPKPGPEAGEGDASGRTPVYNGQGSGMVMSADGYIVTNNHVVEEAEDILVVLRDGREVKAEVRGRDPESDVAVIRLKEKVPGLMPVRFADSEKVRVGEFAIAIGAPFELDYSVTFGHVSAKGRHMDEAARMLADQDFIQTDANINVGNSGGPLVNINGEVIGVNSMIRTSMGVGVGIGFAIPSNLAREIAERLVSDGKFVRSWLGISMGDLREARRTDGFETPVKQGVLVRRIEAGGPAEKSDLKPADVITAVDGRPVASMYQLRGAVSRRKAGTAVTLDVARLDQKLSIRVVLEERPARDQLAGTRKLKPSKDEEAGMDLGMSVKTLTPELAKEYDVEMTDGVVITEVAPDSLAAKFELKPGDVVTDVNHEPVKTSKDFRDQVRKAKGRVLVSFVRDGTKQFEVLKERAR